MKKKLSSFITAMLVLLVCVFASACGDKYKNLQFEVYYAYTADAPESEWHKGTDGININYSLEDDGSEEGSSPIFDEHGGNIYVKIVIKNVDSKDLGKITVSPKSSEGLNFSPKMVNQNQIFELNVDGYVENSLKLYENNSGKKYEIPVNVARKLENIETIESYKAAMPLTADGDYGSLSLLTLEPHVLRYHPIGLTNQKGVTFTVDAIGGYRQNIDTGVNEFVEKYNAGGSKQYAVVENGVLKIADGDFFSLDAYIIRIKATSIFYDGSEEGVDAKEAFFNVYVVDSASLLGVPKVVFEDCDEVNNIVNIYEEGGQYATSSVIVDMSELRNDLIYTQGVLTSDGEASYQTVVSVYDDKSGMYKRYNFDNQDENGSGEIGINGLCVQKDGTKYTFSIASRDIVKNIVKISYELDGFDYSHSQVVDASKFIIVEKGIVPTVIRATESNKVTDLKNNQSSSAQILSISNEDYNGLKFKLEARYSSESNVKIYFEPNYDLIIVNEDDEPVDFIYSGESVYVKFRGNIASSVLTIKALKTPAIYNEKTVTSHEYISVKYNLEKLVTADSFKFVANVNGDDLLGDPLVDAEKQDKIYVRVDYSGEELVASTINLVSSNPKMKFANGETEMDLSQAELKFTGLTLTGKYDIYAIPLSATNSNESSKITISCGDENFVISEDIKVNSVFVMTTLNAENISIDAEAVNEVKKFTKQEIDNGYLNFAIARAEEVLFTVRDGGGRTQTIDRLGWEAVSINDDNFDEGLFEPSINGSIFRVKSYISGKTQVFQLHVTYYVRDEAVQSQTYGQIVSRTSIIKIQIAVFESVGNITRTPSKQTIGYVNDFYKDISSSNITFTSNAMAEGGTPSNKVVFVAADGSLIEMGGASQIVLEFSASEYQLIKQGEMIDIYYYANGRKESLIENNGTVFVENNENILSGSFVVELKKKPSAGYKSVSMVLKALRFGKTSNTATELTINIAEVEKAERILVDGEFVQTGSNSKELQMSFMDVQDGGIDVAEFGASLEFATQTVSPGKLRFDNIETALTYVLYRYKLDDNGNPRLDADGNAIYERVENDFLDVEFKEGKATIEAYKHRGGGLFKLVLATKDSFNQNVDPGSINLSEDHFDKTYSITLRISDGTKQSAFIINNKEDLFSINSNLDKHFVLASNIGYDSSIVNIQPLGVVNIGGTSVVRPFSGGLSGKFTTVVDGNKSKVSSYSIKMKVEQTVETSRGFLSGLFAILGEDATVDNLNLDVEFNSKFNSTSVEGLYVGSLAGINDGTVTNVKVTINQPESVSVGFESIISVNFGGLVALNNGEIINSSIECFDPLKITSNQHLTHNIGMVAGINEGTVTGSYKGKESLDNYIYDVVANLEVVNTNTLNDGWIVKYYVGGVVGTNLGDVKNILVGGQISMGSKTAGDWQSGALGGIAGRSQEDSKIYLATALSLNVKSSSKHIDVAGVVGELTDAIVDTVKYVSAVTEIDGTIVYGELVGINKVAGIAATASLTNGSIKYASVESFIDYVDAAVFNTIQQGATVAGLANVISGTNVEKSFVTANIASTGTIYLTVNTTQTDTYFIGKVDGTVDETEEYLPTYRIVNGLLNGETIDLTGYMGQVNDSNSISDWSIVYRKVDETNYVKTTEFIENETYVFNVENWINVVVSDLASGSTWATEENYNVVKVNGVELFFPYIIRSWEEDGDTKTEPLQIVKPQSIRAEINTNYVTSNNSVHVTEFDYSKYATMVKESVVVNFYKDAGDEANAHNLFSVNNDGLLDLSLLPEDDDLSDNFDKGAQGGYAYEIMGDGHSYAYINSKKQIVFTSASDQNPIIVRIYSVFNSEIELYVAFYSQTLATKLVLSSSSVYNSEEATHDYEINLYTNQNNKVIALKAENILDGYSYQNIFEAKKLAQYLTVQQTSDSATSKLSVDVSNSQNMTIKIRDDLTDAEQITSNESEIITYTLTINKEYFGSYMVDTVEHSFVNSDVTVGEVKLKVNLYNSAKGIDVVGSNAEITTSDDINFDVLLTTEYVKTEPYEDNDIIIEEVKVNSEGELYYELQETDGIRIKIEVVDGESEAEKLCLANGAKNLAEMFAKNAQILSSLYKTKDGEVLGYKYDVFLELEDARISRYIENNIKFKIIVYAVSNSEINNSENPIEILLKPAALRTFTVENYVIKDLNMHTNYTNIVTSGSTGQTSIVEPGGLGNVMMIYLEPAYAQVSSLSIKASSIYVPSLKRTIQVKFSQLALDKRTGENVFTTLSADRANSQVGDTLDLNLISQINRNGIDEYTGIICVRIHIEEPFVGLEETLTITINAKTKSNPEGIVRTKELLTSYLPGTKISYDEDKKVGEGVGSGYLIQKGTSKNEVELKIYGYQFNSNPNFEFSWELPATTQYKYLANDKKHTIYNDLNNNGVYDEDDEDLYLTGDYISYLLDKQIDNIEYNPYDDSYTLKLLVNIAEEMPAPFRISAELSLVTKDGQLKTSGKEDNYIIFYPTDYILSSVGVAGLTETGRRKIQINQQKSIDFVFKTDSVENDLSSVIYQDLLQYAEECQLANPTTKDKLATLFSYYKGGSTITFADKSDSFEYNLINGNTISITGVEKFESIVKFEIFYDYEFINGEYKLVFGERGKSLSTTFTLSIIAVDKKEEVLIYTAEDLYNSNTKQWKLVEGENYVLLNDIELENVAPITTKIGSFDGNNRVISIKSFAVDNSLGEYGLFANIGTYSVEDEETELEVQEQTILKNMIVDYSKFEGTLALNNVETGIVFGGLVAKNDGGLIYNCDVMNLNPAKQAEIDLIVGTNSNVIFGGLVGVNAGNITNSRVGRDSYTKITATKTTESTVLKYAGELSFNIYNKELEGESNKEVNQFSIVAGGFVGENSGIVASSFLKRTNITNFSTNETTNITAGFVGKNMGSGKISYSYSKATEETISISNPYSTGTIVESKGNGIVSGFVYENAGLINNSYSNIELKTDSAYISGFVYNNTGTISECYAAATMNSESVSTYAEQPFVGVDSKGDLLSNGTLENTYYLMRSTTDDPYTDGDKDVAKPLNEENFQNGEYLVGFAFILSNSKVEREQGIWSYYTVGNKKRILPELMNADTISHSHRFVVNEASESISLRNAVSFANGTANNPYIIADEDDFNNVFTEGNNNNNLVGNVRFVNNINFNNDEKAIQTRSNYILGSTQSSTKTSVEGNGMTISGIYLDVGDAIVSKIGLFAEIQNAYVKNLNLEFATPKTDGQFSTTTATYSGGLAGLVEDSAIINIKLNGSDTTLTGSNFVGGVAGLIKGNSLVYGIETNLNVKAIGNENYFYYSQEDYAKLNIQATTKYSYDNYLKHLSYAGGVAGVLDLSKRSNVNYNVQFIDVLGNQMNEKTFDGNVEANILAEYAGGVAGYASRETSSLKLRYFMGDAEFIQGDSSVGGLFGVTLGSVVASQVTAEEEVQYEYDTAFGSYIISLDEDNTKAELKSTETGNINLLKGDKYVGGLIGLGLDELVNASYSKATISSGQIVGGLVGLSVAGTINYSYAIPFVNLSENLSSVGGLIGEAYSVTTRTQERNNDISAYETLLKNKGVNKVTDIQFTYSTIILDESQFNNLTEEQLDNDKIDDVKFDYICADYDAENSACLSSNQNSNLMYVYAGPVNYKNELVTNNTTSTNKSSVVELNRLYNVGDPDQVVSFQEVFSGWSLIKYWSLNDEKYFPLLINETVDNYIEIDSASDLEMIELNPNGKYKVIKDIVVSKDANWIISGEFRGVFVGEMINDDRRPTITVNSLKPKDNNKSSGFFEKTYNATISNLSIVWNCDDQTNKSIDLSNVDSHITMVSGLTCKDEGSLISNIEVRTSLTSEGYGYIINEDVKTIGGFGGIVGEATNTNVLGCNFVGQVKAKLKNNQDEELYFGGVVGNVISNNDSAVINGVTVGAEKELSSQISGLRYPKTSFDLTLSEEIDYPNVYIGGSIGKAFNAAIASNVVGCINANSDDYKQVNIKIEFENGFNRNAHIGGMIAYATDGMISNCESSTNITLSGTVSGNTSLIKAGGLIGEYSLENPSSTSGITKCNSYSKILTKEGTKKLTALNIGSQNKIIMLSTGVATLNKSAVLNQCLITGSINTEGSEISTLYAGGVAAKITSGSSTVDVTEITTTADLIVGTSLTDKLYVGGIAGVANKLNLSYVSSLGRIIPITSGIATDIYVGGLFGKITPENSEKVNIKVNNSYTLTSVIADSITDEAIKELNIGALVGSIPEGSIFAKTLEEEQANNTVNFTNVFYSSDYALSTDENKVGDEYLGTNLSAATMIRKQVWHSDLRTEDNDLNDIWKETLERADLTYAIPYLTALEEAMIKFGVLVKPAGEENYDYVYGSAMNPINIALNKSFNKSTYNYYLLQRDRDGKVPDLETLLTSSVVSGSQRGTLNGILICEDAPMATTFKFNSLVEEEVEGATYKGIIAHVAPHSAISNLHVVIDGDISTISNVTGIIAGLNNGVIYNCSVQGNGINLTGTAGAKVGLIAGNNKGTLSHSFSTAEIILQEGIQAGGIVYMNGGKLYSNYFTGYIENGEAAGIVHSVDDDGSNNILGYIYNNYMAGVITNVKENGNAFHACGEIVGSNNYIDYYSDMVYANSEITPNENNILITKTADLMAGQYIDELDSTKNSSLKGDWYFTVANGNFITNGDGKLVKPFGLNYNYPIYKFNKLICNDDVSLVNEDFDNQLETGTGEVDLSEGPNSDSNFELEERYNILTNTVNSKNYKNAFKIPHLGVLTAVHNLLNEENVTIGNNRNYVVIYDIDGYIDVNKYQEWQGIGSDEAVINGFKNSGLFQGVFITNKYFAYNNATTLDPGAVVAEPPAGEPSVLNENVAYCLIKNLSGKGLFGKLRNAYIGNIKLGSFYNLENSGALGSVVEANIEQVAQEAEPSVSDPIADVKINNFEFVEQSIVSGSGTTTTFGGLFNEIRGTLAIRMITTVNGTNANVALVGNATSICGLVAAKASGNIILEAVLDEDETTLLSTYCAWFIENKYAGGIVGQLSAGATINGNGNYIHIAKTVQNGEDVTVFTDVIGGVVGQTIENAEKPDEKITVNNINVVISGSEIKTNTFGGIVGEVNSKIETNNSIKIIGESEIVFVGMSSNRYYGLVAGLQNANITVQGVEIENILKLSVKCDENGTYDEDITTTGIGTFIGKSLKDCSIEIGYKLDKIEIDVDGVPNVGGIVGFIEDTATAEFENIDHSETEIEISGTTNVGGLYGYVFGDVYTLEIKDIVPTIHIGGINKKATVIKNVGGLFGRWDGSEGSTTEITSKTTIVLEPIANGCVAYNIGGIAGRAETQSSYTDLSFEGTFTTANDLKFYEPDDPQKVDNLVGDHTSQSELCKTVNVGGIFGYVKGASIENALITSDDIAILGYQNVGGIVGYFDSDKTIKNNADLDMSNIKTALVYENLLSYSFVVYYDENGNGSYDEGVDKILSEKESTPSDPSNVGTTLNKISGKVYGVLNIGGAVGYAGPNSSVETIFSFVNVYGNTSVGGIVGFSNQSKIKNNYIYGSSISETDSGTGETKITTTGYVKAIYYNDVTYNKTENKKYVNSFIPTSVGGLVGTATASTIENNLLDGVKVVSTEESQGQVVSTVSNYMADLAIGSGNAGKIEEFINSNQIYDFDKVTVKVEYLDIKTGFGGLAGTIDSASIEIVQEGEASKYAIQNNYLIDIEVNAQLGVNVGTFFGSYKLERSINTTIGAESKNIILATPKLYGTNPFNPVIEVNGAYNVGGIVGFVDGGQGVATYNLSNKDIGGYAKINLQSKIKGFYVGGLIGKTNATQITGVEIVSNNFSLLAAAADISNAYSVTMEMYTDNCLYAGGLIGIAYVDSEAKIVANLGQWTPGEEGTEDEDKFVFTSGSDAIVRSGQDDKFNFGAFIGMLKVAQTGTGIPVSVEGNHNKAFTINVIENGNYYDGQSRFNHKEFDNDPALYLFAEAYYVNMDIFNIVGSKNTALYSASANNPLNSQAKGWSKEYTGFKEIRRNIPRNRNNGAEWDSITTIYNAEKITHVGTVENLGLWADGDSDGINDNTLPGPGINGETGKYPKDYICFTVYEELDSEARLYSSIGSAGVILNYDENTKSTKSYGQVEDNTAGFWDWALGILAGGDYPYQEFYIDFTKDNLRGLTYLTYGESGSWKKYDTISGNSETLRYVAPVKQADGSYSNGSIKHVVYFVEGYLDGDATYSGKNNGAYFVFDILYNNSSLSGLKYNDNVSVSTYYDDYAAASGSIFEVNGIYNEENKNARENLGSTNWLKVGITVVTIVIEVVLFIYSGGASTVFTILKTGIKYIGKKAFRRFIKVLVKFTARKITSFIKKNTFKSAAKFLLKKGAVAMAAIMLGHVTNALMTEMKVRSQAVYFYSQPTNQNMGLLTSTYDRTIRYTKDANGKVVYDKFTDKYHVDDYGATYVYYSATRPIDYQLMEYVGTQIIPNETIDNSTTSITTQDYDSFIEDENFEMIVPFAKGEIVWKKELLVDNDDPENAMKDVKQLVGKDKDGKYWLLESVYTLVDGLYYKNTSAGEVTMERTTLEFTPETYNEMGADIACETPNWIDVNGGVYVHGDFDGTKYSYETNSYTGNNLVATNNGGSVTYTINGKTATAAEHKETSFKYVTDEDTEDIGGTNKDIKGYNYFQGAYYTAGGSSVKSTLGNELIKFAKFVYQEDYNPSSDYSSLGTKDVDYIVKEYTYKGTANSSSGRYFHDGTREYDLNTVQKYLIIDREYRPSTNGDHVLNDSGQPVKIENRYDKFPIKQGVFKIDTASSFLNKGDAGASETVLTGESNAKNFATDSKEIIVPVYPTTFINPYKVYSNSSMKDNFIWTYYDDGAEVEGITFAPTFYVYEGGYKLVDDIVYRRVDTTKETQYGVTLKKVNNASSYISFDANGVAKPKDYDPTDASFIANLVDLGDDSIKTPADILAGYETLKYYFIEDAGAFVGEYYYVEDGALYMADTTYTVGDDGMLYKFHVEIYNEDSQDNPYQGMYLSNNRVQLYTRYKYTNSSSAVSFDSDSLWGDGTTYRIVPKKGTSINYNRETKFVETSRVIFSNATGKEINLALAGSNVATSGKIVVT